MRVCLRESCTCFSSFFSARINLENCGHQKFAKISLHRYFILFSFFSTPARSRLSSRPMTQICHFVNAVTSNWIWIFFFTSFSALCAFANFFGATNIFCFFFFFHHSIACAFEHNIHQKQLVSIEKHSRSTSFLSHKNYSRVTAFSVSSTFYGFFFFEMQSVSSEKKLRELKKKLLFIGFSEKVYFNRNVKKNEIEKSAFCFGKSK